MGPIEGKPSDVLSCKNILVMNVIDRKESNHYFCVPNKVVDQSVINKGIVSKNGDYSLPLPSKN